MMLRLVALGVMYLAWRGIDRVRREEAVEVVEPVKLVEDDKVGTAPVI